MKAIIFDLDGTLVDSLEVFVDVLQKLTKEFDGKPAERLDILQLKNHRTDEVIYTLVKNRSVPFADIRLRYDELYDNHTSSIKLHEGVDELLPILRSMGLKLVAMTSSQQIAEVLRRQEIHNYFQTVAVLGGESHAATVKKILTDMDVAPHETVLVGDRVENIVAGKRSGLGKTVGTTRGYGHSAGLRAAGADHIIRDIPSLLDVLG